MLVVPPVTADATSAVALFFAYPTAVWRTRGQLSGLFGHAWLWLLLVPSLLGGLLGALLLSRTGNRNFIELVPWLVLLGTVIIALRPILVRYRDGHSIQPSFAPAWWLVAIASIFAVALKNLLCGCLPGVAVIVLVLEGDVAWKYGPPMALGGLIGGYIGGMISHRANRIVVRSIAIGIGFAVAGYYFWKLYGPAMTR